MSESCKTWNLTHRVASLPRPAQQRDAGIGVKAVAAQPSKKSSKTTRPHRAAAEPADSFDASRKVDDMIAGLGDWRGERLAEIRRGDEFDEAALKALLREAVAYNTEHSVPKSKGSRAV